MIKLRTITLLAPLLIAFLLFMTTPLSVVAQTAAQKVAQERAASLRQQLADVEAQQTTLQTRLQQLEEDSKPENIEKSLAGVGSTKPEELREQRRRQLETEKNNVQLQLTKLATSKSRLETGVAQADADAYHASAGVNTDGTPAAPARESKDLNISPVVKNQIDNPATVKRRSRRTRRVRSKARRSPTHHALG